MITIDEQFYSSQNSCNKTWKRGVSQYRDIGMQRYENIV
jgi:hypothetical protein